VYNAKGEELVANVYRRMEDGDGSKPRVRQSSLKEAGDWTGFGI
jgi:hypothetical protein